MRKGVIFLVPVPIGNLRDITLRALDILTGDKRNSLEDIKCAQGDISEVTNGYRDQEYHPFTHG